MAQSWQKGNQMVVKKLLFTKIKNWIDKHDIIKALLQFALKTHFWDEIQQL